MTTNFRSQFSPSGRNGETEILQRFSSINLTKNLTRILVVDDDMTQRLLLRTHLEGEGYDVLEAVDGEDALRTLHQHPDIRVLLTDLAMPRMDGYDLIEAVRQQEPRYIYIIVLTGMEDRDSLIRALSLGADDYLTKPVFPDELKLRLMGGARLLRLESQEELVLSLAKLSEFRSEETGYHLERVQHYTRLLARDLAVRHPDLRLSFSIADELAMVSPLHDIGKVAIPDHILHKPGQLTPEEWEIMKTHAAIGGKLLRELFDKTGSPYLWYAYEIAMFHHERWDGKGYPNGLAGEAIPLPARIMTVADVYDALTSDRSYKDAFSHEKAKAIMTEGNGSQFCPLVFDSFLRREEDWLTIKAEFKD